MANNEFIVIYGWNCAHRRFCFCYKCIKYIEIAWQKPRLSFKNKSKEGQITNLKSEINIGKCWVRVLRTHEGVKLTSVWKHPKSLMKQSIFRVYLPLYRSRPLPFNLGYIIELFFKCDFMVAFANMRSYLQWHNADNLKGNVMHPCEKPALTGTALTPAFRVTPLIMLAEILLSSSH